MNITEYLTNQEAIFLTVRLNREENIIFLLCKQENIKCEE